MFEIRPAAELRASRSSKFIGRLIELGVMLAIGAAIGYAVHLFFPQKQTASIGPIAGALGSLLTLALDHPVGNIMASVRKYLRIGERVAPYFGHRIESTHQVLKG